MWIRDWFWCEEIKYHGILILFLLVPFCFFWKIYSLVTIHNSRLTIPGPNLRDTIDVLHLTSPLSRLTFHDSRPEPSGHDSRFTSHLSRLTSLTSHLSHVSPLSRLTSLTISRISTVKFLKKITDLSNESCFPVNGRRPCISPGPLPHF
jgi:hypothetical protein